MTWLVRILLLVASPTVATADLLTLSSRCPPGFEKVATGVCELRTLYQLYDSLQGRGVGGLKTGLPPHRGGFTPEQMDLGRYLFFDPVLSRDGTVACSSCHDPSRGLGDGRGRSLGLGGKTAQRSAPSLWNVGFLGSLFWDGRAESLEQQMLGPLYSEVEMGSSPQHLVETLNGLPGYRELFGQAFPAETENIRLDQVYRAIAAFESSLVSLNSRYDRYAQGHHDALSPGEVEGLNVFRSFVARCAECHTPPLFTNQQLAVIGTPEPDGMPRDPGAGPIHDDPALLAAFKVPSLRNVARTAPYMHSGRFATLREAVAFYTKGRGHAVPEGEELAIHWHIWEPKLTEDELDRLVDFLQALTDETFLPQVPSELPSGLPPGRAPS